MSSSVSQEEDRLVNWFEAAVKIIISVPMIVNAGAAIALGNHFERGHQLMIAEVFFIVGAAIGLFTLTFEYLTPYIALKVFKKFMFDENNSIKGDFDTYKKDLDKRISQTIIIRIINGGLGFLCGFLGMILALSYVANACVAIILFSVLILWFVIVSLWICYSLKIKD